MVIVTGMPRSRTSMITQMLELSGLFLGNVIQETKANPQKQLENTTIIRDVQKKHLKKYKFDPKGQNPLPPLKWHEPDPTRRDMVLNIMKKQGLTNQIWGFKDAKACLDWRTWDDAFPEAFWIVTKRNISDVVKSCLNTSFMSKYKNEKGWQYWVTEYQKRIEDMLANLNNIQVLDTDDILNFKFDALEHTIKKIGLTWDYDKIKAQVRPI